MWEGIQRRLGGVLGRVSERDGGSRTAGRFARFILLSALGPALSFSASGTPPSAYAQPWVSIKQSQTRKKFSLPTDEGAWLLTIFTAGGYLGRKGSLVLTSEGNAAAGGNYEYTCTAKLADEELRRLNRLVASAMFDELRPSGEGRREKMSDTISIRLELQRRESDGTVSTFTALWENPADNSIPDSLLALRRAMAGLEKKVIEKCIDYR